MKEYLIEYRTRNDSSYQQQRVSGYNANDAQKRLKKMYDVIAIVNCEEV